MIAVLFECPRCGNCWRIHEWFVDPDGPYYCATCGERGEIVLKEDLR